MRGGYRRDSQKDQLELCYRIYSYITIASDHTRPEASVSRLASMSGGDEWQQGMLQSRQEIGRGRRRSEQRRTSRMQSQRCCRLHCFEHPRLGRRPRRRVHHVLPLLTLDHADPVLRPHKPFLQIARHRPGLFVHALVDGRDPAEHRRCRCVMLDRHRCSALVGNWKRLALAVDGGSRSAGGNSGRRFVDFRLRGKTRGGVAALLPDGLLEQALDGLSFLCTQER